MGFYGMDIGEVFESSPATRELRRTHPRLAKIIASHLPALQDSVAASAAAEEPFGMGPLIRTQLQIYRTILESSFFQEVEALNPAIADELRRRVNLVIASITERLARAEGLDAEEESEHLSAGLSNYTLIMFSLLRRSKCGEVFAAQPTLFIGELVVI